MSEPPSQTQSTKPSWTKLELQRLIQTATVSVLGLGALWVGSPWIERAWARPLVNVGVLLAALGPALAVALLVAPRRTAIRWRHFVAGAGAAWLAIVLAGAARRFGISGDSGLFRALWAPLAEECSKALLLAILLSRTDQDGERDAIATAGVVVGAGFAFRENIVYFATSLDGRGLPLEWLILRAIPPVFAHTFFGATYGTILAQSAIHHRALELRSPRFSWMALSLATLAHFAYNALPWALVSVVPAIAVGLAVGWSSLALCAAWLLARRVRAMSAEDPAREDRVSVPSAPLDDWARERQDAKALVVASLVVLSLWLIPLGLPRYLAVSLTPIALSLLVLVPLSRLGVSTRAWSWVFVGLAVRPLVSLTEGAFGALLYTSRHRWGTWAVLWAGHLLWGAVALWVSRSRAVRSNPRGAAFVAAALACGMVSASIGANIAAGSMFAPWRELFVALLRLMLRTAFLSALIASAGQKSVLRGVLVMLGASLASFGLDRLIVRFHLVAAVFQSVVFASLIALWLVHARRRAQSLSTSPT